MPSSRRQSFCDADMLVKHSLSDLSKISVPMWDSSDPDRAPPPLPLNPGSPNMTTRPNTSAAIAATAKALEEKARESAPASAYTTNPMPPKATGSPERSLIKGAAHKRMQSLQDTNLRDFRQFLNTSRTPERSPERPGSRAGAPANPENSTSPPSSPEKLPSGMSTPTPSNRDFLKDTPSLRPSSRSHHKAILGENTPPSATYMALQSMPVRDFDSPLQDTTNGSTPRAKNQEPDNLSHQIREIATIALNLQREMAQLSRRSKDNATDLISLKEATNSRDEDIRKSLRDLVNNISATSILSPPHAPGMHSRSNSFGGFCPPGTPPASDKNGFRLPRMNSPFLDERIGSPNPYSIEGAASVAMLEKIVREMVTKEGQERLINTLNTLFEKANQESTDAAKKVGELVEFIKQGSDSRALTIREAAANGELGTSSDAGPVARATREINAAFGLPTNDANGSKPYTSPKAADFVSADMLKLLKKIKDSVTESGCVTAEVKALVRDLRGEVLGMGRELGRKIDQVTPNSSGALALEDGREREDVARIVQEGLADLKEQFDRVLHQKRRGSASSVMSRNSVDNQEVYAVVKHALAEQGIERGQQAHGTPLDRDAILEAVKEAYENYKPEIELQQFGLERDEILECLREGLEQYRASAPAPESTSINRDEIMDAVMEAMQHVNLAQPVGEAHEIREEVLSAVRECLDEIRPSMQVGMPSHQPDADVTRGILLEAVREGFETHGPNAARELEISRDDLFDAVKAGLEGAPRELEISREDLFEAIKAGLEGTKTPLGGYGQEVMTRLQELVEDMHGEFKAYSSANGRDTDQVLDAMKDGLESLRAEVESYVDRAQDVTGKDEILDSMRNGLDSLRTDVQAFVAAGPQGDQALNRGEMLDYIRSEFEHLHEAMNNQMVPPPAAGDKEEVLRVLNENFDGLKAHMEARAQEDSIKEEMEEAMKAEFETLRDSILSGGASHRDEILDTIHASLENLHVKLEAREEANQAPQSNEEILGTMKEEFEHLRETLATTLVKSGADEHRDDIIDAIRENMDALRTQMTADQGESSKETLGTVKDELEHLRETLGSTIVRGGSFEDKEEILEALRVGLESIKDAQGQSQGNVGLSEEVLQALHEQLEHLRKSIAGNVASRADTEEILETLRLGLDDLRSHLEKKIDNPERQMSVTGEILDALNEGVEGLRSDIGKIQVSAPPMDMSVNYEILETLKEGIQTITTEITRLKGDKQATVEDDISAVGNEVVLAEDPDMVLSREVPAVNDTPATLKRDDLKELEVLLTQLQIKVEAMDANMQNLPPASASSEPAPGVAMKDDLDGVASKEDLAGIALKEDLANVEELLKDVQAAITILSEDKRRDTEIIEGVAKKEDTDAIEVLLQNTKAMLDEMVLPDPETTVKKEHLDVVEAAVLVANETLDKLTAKIDGEEVASKGDVAVVEVLVQDVKTALDELKNAKPSEEEEAKKVTKEDLESIGALITEIKEKFATIPDAESVPSKADVEQLVGLIHDFRDSHDKMKEGYENDIGVTAKAFDDRKNEADTIITKVGEVKEFLDAVKEEIKTKLQEGGEGVDGLKETIKGLEESINTNFNVTADVKELMETVTREFERAHGSIEGLKTESEEKATSSLEKHDEVKGAIVTEMSEKLDEKFGEMMSKYDDMLVLAEAQAQKIDDKTAQQEELMNNSKNMTEELKVTVDTLGTSLTAMNTAFAETTEKISGDSTTVFNKIDEAVTKMDEKHEDNKTEHQLTRDEVAKALTTLTALQDELTENHPKFMVTLHEVLALVNQHYEHSKSSQEAALDAFKAAAQEAAQEQARVAVEESNSRSEELKESFFAGLPALLPASSEPVEKFDDTQLHDKLDRLLGHASEAEKSTAQLERLDQIHQQVMDTAVEVTEFVQMQTKLIAEGHDSREKEAEEVALLLERRLVQKDQIEADIHNLNDEKDSLRQVVEALRHEKETLAVQKSRLNADVSALEMALNIRREELQHMENKADALERRILNGIMDHSRALLLAKGTKTSKGNRVVSNTSQNDQSSMPPPSVGAKGLTMALNPRPAVRRHNAGQTTNPAARRILSLSQISGNTPTGGTHGFSAGPNTGLKRSHSVKTNYGMRKSSWGNKRVVSDVNKENEILSEESEDELAEHSEAGTERRHSRANSTATTGTDFASTYGDDRSESRYEESVGGTEEGVTPGTDRRSSYGAGSEYTYGTGSSYLTGSDVGSTIRSTLGGGTTAIDEGADNDGGDGGESIYESDEGEHTEIPHDAASDDATSVHTATSIHEDEDEESTAKVKVADAAEAHGDANANDDANADAHANADADADATTGAETEVPKKDFASFATPTDSGLGTDLPTAAGAAALSGEDTDYFRRVAEEEASQVSSAVQ